MEGAVNTFWENGIDMIIEKWRKQLIADAIQKKMQSEGHKAASRLEKDWLKLYKDQMGGERDSGGGGR